MYYSDSIQKGFLNAGTYIPYLAGSTPLSKWTDYEDPTYLGFALRFWFQPKDWGPDGMGMDYLPQGLLLADVQDPSKGELMPLADSAQAYLRRRNEFYRAKMMQQFREGLSDIVYNTPYMFQKVSGLADLYKIDPKNNWRAKDKKITIECLETISLKMTYLADLYRKAAWDSAYHRWILPDVQRFFSMEIIVAEIRNMQILPDAPREFPTEENSLLNQVIGLAGNNSKLNDIANSNAAQAFLDLINRENDSVSPTYWSTKTFLKFTLDFCEFDFFSEAPPFLDSVADTPSNDPTTMKFVIKVGRVSEVNTYGLLGGLLSDTWSQYDRGKAARDANFGGDNMNTAAGSLTAEKGLDTQLDFTDADRIRAQRAAERRKSPIGLTNNKSLQRGGGGPTTGAPPNPLIPDFDLGVIGKAFPGLEQGLDQAVDAANSFAQNLGSKKPELGNVYGMTPGQLAAAIGVLLNPNGAASQFMQGLAGSQQMQEDLGNAFAADFTGQEFVSLIDSDGVIGKASALAGILANTPPDLVQGFIGAIDMMADAVAGTPLQGQSVSDIIAIVASQNLQGQEAQASLESAPINTASPSNVNLQAPSILNTALGKVLFDSSLPTSNPGGKVVLSSADVNPLNDKVVELKGKKPSTSLSQYQEELTGAMPEMQMDDSVPLTGAPAEVSTDTKVPLNEAPPSKDTTKKREELSGPQTPKAFAQNIEFDASKKPEPADESVQLDAPKIEPERLKKVDLIEPTINNPTLGNADLDGPTIDKPKLGNVNLE